ERDDIQLDRTVYPYLLRETMNNLDVLLLISSRLDNETLKNLSKTPIWNEISKFTGEQYFWHLRVENLISREIDRSLTANWKSVYYALLDVLDDPEWYHALDTSNITAIKILLDLGYDPTLEDNAILQYSIQNGHTESA